MPAKSTLYNLDVLPDPTLATPVASTVKFFENTANGANSVGLKGPASLASDLTLTLPSAVGGVSNQPLVNSSGTGTLEFSNSITISTALFDNQGIARFQELTANGGRFVALRAPADITALSDLYLTLPQADGSANTPMVTSGAGVLSFSTTLANMVSITSTAFTSSGQAALSLGPFGVSAGNTGELRFLELAANGVNYVGFKSPDSITTNRIWTLPSADGTNGQALTTNGSGTLSFTTVGGGSGSLQIVEFTATTTSASSSTTLATGAVPVSVSLQITSAYSPGTSISVGYTGSTSFLMATTDNLPGTTGIYTVNLMGLSWTSNPVLVTIAGAPLTGACRVRVIYATTVNT
jgi:hypothetical protein